MTELKYIKGLGDKNINLLNKLNITSCEELLEFYPFRYEDYKRSNLSTIKNDDRIVIDGIIETVPSIFYFNKKMNKMSFKLNTGTNLFNIYIYNRGYLKSKMKPGMEVTIIGKLDKNSITATNIKFELLDKEIIEPIYHQTYGLTNKQISKFIYEALSLNITIDNLIPQAIMNKYKFIDKNICINILHNPKDINQLKKCMTQIKYEELFLFMLKMNYLKNNKEGKIGLKRSVDYTLVSNMIDKIPFSLTTDQIKSVKEIYDDLISPKKMNRLLQGDVGSGKTIVSFITLYINYLSGYQGALMSPTEILAVQHYENIINLFKEYNINIALLTGKTKLKEKKQIYEDLKNGKINIIVGTHALFTDNVIYGNLGLVITDEQHRFGVNQRSNLKNKGLTPDVLYMSATPIPRTYALTLYGDMDISNIKTLPNGKKEIITILKKETEIKDVLSMMYIELKENHQVYVIAPLIEESESIDLKNVNDIADKMNRAFGKLYNIGILHGRMSDNEKNETMDKFKNNEIQILISTTVIEVGVDVKNATMMVIFDSFRFGLSALHQLRGRVGRNNLQSYCILISNRETERLNILVKTNDGFKISEEDFLLRGSGDLFGYKQSGDMVFKVADFKRDYKILLKAKEDSQIFLQNYSENNNSNILINDYIKKFSNLD